VLALKTRKDIFGGLTTDVNTKEIAKTSRMVSKLMGCRSSEQGDRRDERLRPFLGIHQDGSSRTAPRTRSSAGGRGGDGAHVRPHRRSGRAALKHHISGWGTT